MSDKAPRLGAELAHLVDGILAFLEQIEHDRYGHAAEALGAVRAFAVYAVIDVNDHPAAMCADGDASAHMRHDDVCLIEFLAVLLAVTPYNRLLVEAVEYAGTLDAGKTGELGDWSSLVNDDRIGNKIGFIVFLAQLPCKYSAEAGGMGKCGGQVFEVIEQLIIYGIGSAEHGLYDTAPADEAVY